MPLGRNRPKRFGTLSWLKETLYATNRTVHNFSHGPSLINHDEEPPAVLYCKQASKQHAADKDLWGKTVQRNLTLRFTPGQQRSINIGVTSPAQSGGVMMGPGSSRPAGPGSPAEEGNIQRSTNKKSDPVYNDNPICHKKTPNQK